MGKESLISSSGTGFFCKIFVKFFRPDTDGGVDGWIFVAGRACSGSSSDVVEDEASSSPSTSSSSSSSSFESLRKLDCVRMDEQDRSLRNRRMLGLWTRVPTLTVCLAGSGWAWDAGWTVIRTCWISSSARFGRVAASTDELRTDMFVCGAVGCPIMRMLMDSGAVCGWCIRIWIRGFSGSGG